MPGVDYVNQNRMAMIVWHPFSQNIYETTYINALSMDPWTNLLLKVLVLLIDVFVVYPNYQ